MTNRSILDIVKGVTIQKDNYIEGGIYRKPSLGLISLSSDGENRITIADKNLGATQVYNDGDTLNEANCGKFYQRGNNYGFPREGEVTTSSTQVDASGYGPGNYYSDDTFIIGNADWANPSNDNLWGGETGTVESMQGPCPEGYHVPSNDENNRLLGILSNLWINLTNPICRDLLKIPLSGYRQNSNSNVVSKGNSCCYLSTNRYHTGTGIWYIICDSHGIYIRGSYTCSHGYSIRPFKNTPIIPNSTWIKLHGKGWEPGENTIAYYPFGAGGGSLTDDASGNRHHLRTPTAVISGGSIGGVPCVTFDNYNSEALYCPSLTSQDIGTTFTINFWFNTDFAPNVGTETDYKFVSTCKQSPYRGRDAGVYTNNVDITDFNFETLDGSSHTARTTTLPTSNVWHNYIATYTPNTIKLYLDGQQIATTTGGLNVSSDGILQVARAVRSDDNINGYYKGGMSRLIIENKVWDASEVLKYYNQSKSFYNR